MSNIPTTLKRGQLIRTNHRIGTLAQGKCHVTLSFCQVEYEDAERILAILEVAGIIPTPDMPIAGIPDGVRMASNEKDEPYPHNLPF